MSEKLREQVTVEPPKKKTTICSVKRVFLGVLFLLGLGGSVFASIELDREIKRELGKKINDTEKYLRRIIDKTDKRMTDFQKEIDQLRQMKTSDRSAPKTDLRQEFKEMKDHLNYLISTVGNLSATLSKMNVSSESKITRLRRNLNDARNDLIRLQIELSHLNYTLHKDMAHFSSSIVSAVKDLQQELLTLSNSTSTKADELWKHWNRTDDEIEDIVNLMSQQNESLHFKIAYHSDALRSEVKNVEEKQLKLYNYTIKIVKKFRSELNNTRQRFDRLKLSFSNEISQVNRSWQKAIEDVDGNLRSSMTKMNAKVDGMKKQIQTNINDVVKTQKEMKDDFSETKTKLQEKDRKHDSAISGEKSKMKVFEGKLNSRTRKIASQEQELENLRSRVEKIEKNGANRILKTNIITILSLSLITAAILNV